MYLYLINKLKKTVVTLRYSILSIFITLFVIAILVLISIQYIRASKTIIFIATELMKEASNDLSYKFKSELIKIKRDNETIAKLIQEKILNLNNLAEMSSYINNLNADLLVVQQAYWCDEKGDCINSLHEPNGTITSDLIFNSKKPPYREYIFHDKNRKVIETNRKYQFEYDPRSRPWYIDAKEAKKTIWTDSYLLKDQPYLAFTVATPVYKKNKEFLGVFGMDIRLDWLSNYLEDFSLSKNSNIFIVNKTGKLIAFPVVYKKEEQLLNLIDIHSINMPWISKSFDLFQKTGKNFFRFTYEGETYLANYMTSTDEAIRNWIIGIVAPEDDFTRELQKAILIDILIGIIILGIGMLLISAFTNRIVKPIKKLVKETEKIKNFNLQDEEKIESRILEVMLLSDAIQSMRLGLKTFQKYVPASLVRQLIEVGEDVHMGGAKKNLVIFFSDIKNFTTLSEKIDPTELLQHMCEYFEEISTIIVTEKGTIDKYIGDSIMAFWGAPLPVENPCQFAARAALKAITRIKALNDIWKKENKPTLSTRIGLHMGDVIVGNVGSTERINYTALGDAINIASRLEGVNKIYGTSIIVSESIYQEIRNQFILRKLDCVTVKGKKQSGYIYELLAENHHQITFDIEKYCEVFETGFAAYQEQHWDDALLAFKKCLAIYPEDTVALVFIERCEKLKLNPPTNWDGIWSFE